MRELLDLERDARVFCDGLDGTEPRLDHPEGVAVHADGSIWCGGEAGQIFRIAPDGRSRELVASTDGFCLGIAFDEGCAHLYACDMLQAAVFRLELASGRLERFADGMRIPNAVAVDPAGRVYVSDSHDAEQPGPGVWRFEPHGDGGLWDDRARRFANGIALVPDGASLCVAESFGRRVVRVAIEPDGSPGPEEVVAELPGVLPDGLAFDARGRLYVGCYEPSQVLRIEPGGAAAVLVRDADAHTLCHPTNLAFRGGTLFTANLGRWHLTAIDVPDAV